MLNPDEEITISYTSLMTSTRTRRRLLRDNWCFECSCTRCRDPTEMGSHLGSLRCQQCREEGEEQGWMVMKDPMDFESEYK